MRSTAVVLGLLAFTVQAHASTLLIVGEDRRINQENILNLRDQALRRSWHVLRWKPGSPISGALGGDEIVIVGAIGDAGKAVTALTRLAVRLDARRPVTVRMPMDALYGEFGSMGQFQDPAGFFAKSVVPDWLPSDASLPAERSLRFEVRDHGRTHTVLSRGGGAGEIAVYLDITDLKSLATPVPSRPTPPSPQRPKRPTAIAPSVLRAMNLGDLPGTPLETEKRAGMWFGRGQQAVGAGWGTVSESMGKVNYAHAEGSFQNTPEGNGLPFGGIGTVNTDYYDQNGVTRAQVDAAMIGENNGASVRFLHQSAGFDTYTLVRAGGLRRDKLGPFRNDANVKVGYLMTQTTLPGGASERGEPQLLWGAGDTVSLGFNFSKLSLVAQAGADAVWSRMYGKTQWDNYRLHGGVEATIPLSSDLHLMGQYKHRLLENNPEKYFFTPTLSDDQALAGLAWKRGRFGAGVLAGVQRLRGEQADDNRKKGGAWLTAWDTTLTGLASRGDWTQEVTLALSRKVAKDWDVEAYVNRDSMVRYDYKKETVGVRLSWGFGNSGSGLPDERRYRASRDDLYAQRFYQDRGLPQEVFSAQTSSVRQVNEWSGKNLQYVTGAADKWSRTPSETYGGRAGDCDEQAWLVSNSLNDNAEFRGRGGKAYILDYWTQTGGHGVSLVEEGGKVYLNEYGRTYRINVDPNASMEAKGQAALQQVGRYLALKPTNGDPLQYVVFGTKNGAPPAPGEYDMAYYNDPNRKSDWVYSDTFETKDAPHPPVETGINALLGVDSF